MWEKNRKGRKECHQRGCLGEGWFFLQKGGGKHLTGSVTVVALVAVTLLFLVSMMITTLVQSGFLQTERSAKKNKTRWFLEGQIAKWFSQWEEGLPSSGKWRWDTPSGKGELVWEIGQTNWVLEAKGGEGISRSEIVLEGVVSPLFSTTVFWVYPVTFSLHAPWEIRGSVALSPESEVATNTYAWQIKGGCLLGDAREARFFPAVSKTILPEVWEKRVDFGSLWRIARQMVREPWLITEEGMAMVREIVNPLHPDKIFLGSGKTTFSFPFRWQAQMGVYIRKKKDTSGDWKEFLYYRGAQREQVVGVDEENTLVLHLSRDPYLKQELPLVELPSEAWERLGEVLLEGKDTSLLSREEEVWAFRVGGRYYFEESDFVYEKSQKRIRIFSGEFFRRHVIDVAIANGVSKEYTLPSVRGKVIVYVDGERVWNYRRTQTRLIFDTAPSPGSRIQLLRGIEDFALYKKPPTAEQAVFVDRVERCVVLDLENMENLPENGVVYATLPLLVRGTAREPVAIVGEASLYVENINPHGGAPVVLASRVGVWLWQTESSPRILKNVVVISPLAGLYTVGETFVPATVEGVGIFAIFQPTKGLDGFMEHTFVSGALSLKDVPLLEKMPRPLFVRRLWRR
ncbi:MAG: hypothetical protein N2314_08670 [Brevinematales bacterium]|nr:hypothetical protein [Brevinematales bacterium]